MTYDYDYEPINDELDDWQGLLSDTVITRACNALCAHCRHMQVARHKPDPFTCLQGTCDTLERIIGRLSDMQYGDSDDDEMS
jgi:hypothetical protein